MTRYALSSNRSYNDDKRDPRLPPPPPPFSPRRVGWHSRAGIREGGGLTSLQRSLRVPTPVSSYGPSSPFVFLLSS